MDKDIVTTNKNEFLKSEMVFYGDSDFEYFKNIMNDMVDKCDKCGVYFWKDCKKRCECDQK